MHPRVFRIFACPVTLRRNVCAASTSRRLSRTIRPVRVLAGYGLVRLVRPGGMIVLGVYNAFARIPLRLRRLVACLSAYRCIPFDPVLRDRENEPARRTAWLRDQYRHPEEHRHTLAEVQTWFAENGVHYIRAYPSALLGDEPDQDALFESAADSWRFEGWLTQIGWIASLGHEGGLFVTVGRRT